jgi:cytochrome c5
MTIICKTIGFFLIVLLFLAQCTSEKDRLTGRWDYVHQEEEGSLTISKSGDVYHASLKSFDLGSIELEEVTLEDSVLTGEFKKWDDDIKFTARFSSDSVMGKFDFGNSELNFRGSRFIDNYKPIKRSGISYLLADKDLVAYEEDIDHAKLIANFDQEYLRRGKRIYNNNCINCHGTPKMEGSIPLSLKFWEEPFKAGNDPFSMYATLTKGVGSMPPQITLTPKEKYDVIAYIRETYIRESNPTEYYQFGDKYLASLPKGNSTGPEIKPYHPWKDMDYGNFFINTYELVDSATGIERYHSPGPSPYPDEDYSKNNFAYKGIAVRLDKGEGGVAKGNAFMIFDHDVMRVAGGWTGEGFIDWKAILLNDEHETYPRTVGKLHFETPVGPGWANPQTGKFDDPRFTARDGRQFGPLPKKWASYKGLYHFEDHVVISYSVGGSNVLEEFGMETSEGKPIFTRTLNVSPSQSILQMRIAPVGNTVKISGDGVLKDANGYVILELPKSQAAKTKIFIASEGVSDEVISRLVKNSVADDLIKYTKGGQAHYPETVKSIITVGRDKGAFAVDELTPPFENPWNCRMKLSGIDFMSDANKAVACATDGDIWMISGLTENSGELEWRRIGSGLFQPLGIKVLDDKIFVTCRDQIVLLQDLNDDGETDFYESFNHDHQVTDHFHEFAMGLQADDKGNLYYAKSGRHAREALIPQHGTLIKVSKDGSTSEIVATGFRAANGVCINPDGSFIVTDQQGYWNPMNRINWVEVGGKEKFYGNMWGYNPPKDSSRAAMEQPLTWVDMEFDRSPSELLWVESDAWGPLDGSLLSFSYGYGKIQLVLQEKVGKYRQGGVIDLPGIKFMTGVMRGRFNPEDGQLYACGMSAWGTSQLMKGGGLYRIRYTGEALTVPLELNINQNSLDISFAQELDESTAQAIGNYEISAWDLKRSKKYGSDRYNKRTLKVEAVTLAPDGKTVRLTLPELAPVDVMTIHYKLKDVNGKELEGTLQNTIHQEGGRNDLEI